MNKIEKKIKDLQQKQNEIREKMSAAVESGEGFDKLEREHKAIGREIEELQQSLAMEKRGQDNRDANAILREALKGARDSKSDREIVLNKKTVADKTSIEESGAINLTIKDIIPTIEEGGVIDVPGLKIVTGVTGNELYPVSIDDVDMEEVGEVVALNDQDLHFDEIVVKPGRAGLSVAISNEAIDNAQFDLLGFVQGKFQAALNRYLAKKVFSRAAWTGIKGAFSGITAAGTITISSGTTAYADILKAVAAFTNKGFDANKVCLVVSPTTEAALKALPKAQGQGGFVIEGGKLAGYDYVVNHYIDTELDSNGNLVASSTSVIGIGYFDYLAVQQHGNVRLTIDATSKGVAVKNCTAVVLNTSFSITDLSVKLNGSTTGATQAFAAYTLA